MAFWLFKSEPDVFSFDDLIARGATGEQWDGVRNYQARNNMRAMKKGERGFFYHSNEGKAVVGIVEVIRPYYPDHTDETGRFGMVDVRAVRALPRPVTLAAIKAEPALEGIALVRQSRLSVMPVSPEHWAALCRMGAWREDGQGEAAA